MSHVDSDIISRVLADTESEYGNIVKMTITRVNIHKYLGMTIEYSLAGKVKLSIVGWIGNILDDNPEDMKD